MLNKNYLHVRSLQLLTQKLKMHVGIKDVFNSFMLMKIFDFKRNYLVFYPNLFRASAVGT